MIRTRNLSLAREQKKNIKQKKCSGKNLEKVRKIRELFGFNSVKVRSTE